MTNIKLSPNEIAIIKEALESRLIKYVNGLALSSEKGDRRGCIWICKRIDEAKVLYEKISGQEWGS